MQHCIMQLPLFDGRMEGLCSIQMEVTELEHYLLGAEDADICIKSFGRGER